MLQVSEGVRGVTLEALVAAHPAGRAAAAAALQQPQGRTKQPLSGAALRQHIMALEAQAAGVTLLDASFQISVPDGPAASMERCCGACATDMIASVICLCLHL